MVHRLWCILSLTIWDYARSSLLVIYFMFYKKKRLNRLYGLYFMKTYILNKKKIDHYVTPYSK